MASIKKGVVFYEGNSYYHRVKLLQEDGSTKYSKRGGFASAEEAEKSYYKYEEMYKKALRKYQMNNSNVNANIGFRDYLLYWLEEVFSQRIESSTRMLAVYVLYDLILPCLSQDIKLKYVNSDYLDSLLEEVSKISESSGNKSRELLNIAFKDAVVQGFITVNPVETTKKYPRKPPKITVLSKEKLKKFLSAAYSSPWYLEILLALFNGLRKGEIAGLKCSDFGIDERIVRIERQVTANPVIPAGETKITKCLVEEKEPKTENSYRSLRVPEATIKELQKRFNQIEMNKKDKGDEYYDKGFISCQPNGLPHSASAFNTALTKLCKKNGLPHISPHGLRHLYATILLEQGVPLVKISAMLGHQSVVTTFEYYCDQMDEAENILSFMNDTFTSSGEDGR